MRLYNKSVEIIDEASGLVKRSGMCYIVFREGEILRGDIFCTRVLLEKLKDLSVSKIALIGTNPHAKAFSLMACGFQLSYFNESLEELMGFCDEMQLKSPDVNRIADSMNIDFSRFDALLDFSNLDNFNMAEKLALYNLDMKNDKEYSALKLRAGQLGAEYIGYDDMLEELTTQAFKIIDKK